MRRDKPWYLALVGGIFTLAMGLYTLLFPVSAANAIGLLAAVYLVIVGFILLIGGLGRSEGGALSGTTRGVVGILVGVVLLASLAFGFMTDQTFGVVLAASLIVLGLLGVFAGFYDRGSGDFSWGPIIVNILLLAWGILIFLASGQGLNLTDVSGWALTAVGSITLLWALTTSVSEAVDVGAMP